MQASAVITCCVLQQILAVRSIRMESFLTALIRVRIISKEHFNSAKHPGILFVLLLSMNQERKHPSLQNTIICGEEHQGIMMTYLLLTEKCFHSHGILLLLTQKQTS